MDTHRLSATQRLTARGLMLLGAAVMLAGVLGAQQGQPGPLLFTGTVDVGALLVAPPPQPLNPSTSAAAELRRARALVDYAVRYDIDVSLAAAIYDIAGEEGVDPELGFRVVAVESAFNPQAISSAGALGLAQVMPGTARIYEPDLDDNALFAVETNLRIGFRFLRWLIDRYDGDLSLALLAYNRGPTRVSGLLARGVDPRNGYASLVLDGYPTVSAVNGLQ